MSPSLQTASALPARRERLKRFVALKAEARAWRIAAILLFVAASLMMFRLLSAPEPVADDGPVLLGAGKAGVDLPEPAAEELAAAEASAEAALPDADVAAPASPAGEGQASYYGPGLEGNPTASGETFDPEKLTAAHRSLPIGSMVRVTHSRSGESVTVRINDRGPFHGNRIIDLSVAAARELGMLNSGTARVRLELLD
ncbi:MULTISPECIES: septal ring lytic transglycosylase RlpA family protein [Pacificimonas]|nr:MULTISPECIES: septal ring lytic transglycosylase RlpA family protein [Pacificimonas]